MKFIYDILMNLDEKLYEFYEWNIDDDIEYFKKVPLFKVNDSVYKNIVMNSIIDDQKFLDSIYNMSEIYDNKKVKLVNYACLFTNGREAVGVLLNKGGKIIMVSRLYIDEENEVLDLVYGINDMNIPVINSNIIEDKDKFLTRSELQKKKFLFKELNELYNNKKTDKLKYMHYECFNRIEEDINLIYDRIKQFLNKDWDQRHNNLYDLVRLSYSKK